VTVDVGTGVAVGPGVGDGLLVAVGLGRRGSAVAEGSRIGDGVGFDSGVATNAVGFGSNSGVIVFGDGAFEGGSGKEARVVASMVASILDRAVCVDSTATATVASTSGVDGSMESVVSPVHAAAIANNPATSAISSLITPYSISMCVSRDGKILPPLNALSFRYDITHTPLPEVRRGLLPL